MLDFCFPYTKTNRVCEVYPRKTTTQRSTMGFPSTPLKSHLEVPHSGTRLCPRSPSQFGLAWLSPSVGKWEDFSLDIACGQLLKIKCETNSVPLFSGLTSGISSALSGVALSASLLPPVVNSGDMYPPFSFSLSLRTCVLCVCLCVIACCRHALCLEPHLSRSSYGSQRGQRDGIQPALLQPGLRLHILHHCGAKFLISLCFDKIA